VKFVADAATIDAELRLVAGLRRTARERGGPLPSIAVADALLDERRELTALAGVVDAKQVTFPKLAASPA
jgi:hypothetical protein